MTRRELWDCCATTMRNCNTKEVKELKNVSMKQEGTKLVIEVDLSQDFGKSKSGKSTIIASTEGNQSIETGDEVVYIGLNIYKKG